VIAPIGKNRVNLAIGQFFPDVYRWHVSESSLTFAKISDPDSDRTAVFAGVSKRK
jgi:hypothetical protein